MKKSSKKSADFLNVDSNDKQSVSDKKSAKSVDKLSSKTSSNDIKKTNECIRRSTRVRKATDRYSSEIANQKKCTNNESNTVDKSGETVTKPKSKGKPKRQKKSGVRKGIGKLLYDYRNRNKIPDFQKRLKYVEKDPVIEILHKKLGLVSTRLSAIPESNDEF